MADVDKWLTDAARVTRDDHHRADAGRILRRLATEPSPALALARHDARLTMLCAAAAAMIAFAGIETIATSAWEKPSATWLSMPPAASPFGLLVGE
ncbi:CnrY/NccY family anti-sigma factor [Cupriavidus basilensis]|uniref:CnrY/NccY family anti-sigma factor n=1 Tax=Cupriavidus basilensis TaxID=68895 RepID=UPI0020A66970|nr:CnrY/NccY family anti-sigma factor [Cupriavidus basilensis]MCP3024034.1 CnrY/NccY family anti-sigma factor [Cupriavidus basilensis]